MAGDNGCWKRRVRRLMGQILFTSEETDEGPTSFCCRVTKRSAQHRICSFESIEEQPLCRSPLDVQLNLGSGPGKGAEVAG